MPLGKLSLTLASALLHADRAKYWKEFMYYIHVLYTLRLPFHIFLNRLFMNANEEISSVGGEIRENMFLNVFRRDFIRYWEEQIQGNSRESNLGFEFHNWEEISISSQLEVYSNREPQAENWQRSPRSSWYLKADSWSKISGTSEWLQRVNSFFQICVTNTHI